MKNVNDKISMEYEARNSLNEDQYIKILNDFSNAQNIEKIINENHYYDVDDLFLTNHGMVLRKRFIGNLKELTLKVKQSDGDQEITIQYSNENTIDNLLSETMVTLLSKHINVLDLKEVGYLKTERIEIPLQQSLLVIDKNYYNEKTDFNLEVESNSREEAQKVLNELLKNMASKLTPNTWVNLEEQY